VGQVGRFHRRHLLSRIFSEHTDGTQGRAAAPANGEVLRRVTSARWGIQTSATFQSIPGPQILANYTATNAQVRGIAHARPSRRAPTGTVTIPLIKPGTMYADRLNQLDFRLSRVFTVFAQPA